MDCGVAIELFCSAECVGMVVVAEEPDVVAWADITGMG